MSSSLAMPPEGKPSTAGAKQHARPVVQNPEAASSPDQAKTGAVRPGFVWESEEFGAIYQEHSQVIYYLALRLLGDAALAQDATHDVFLKAFRKMDTFRGEAGIRTWLYRITINHCQNMNQSWHARHMFSNADEAVWETAGTVEGDPLRVLEIKELGQRIQKTLDGLTEEYRLLLLLVADQQLSYDEIGELTEQTADAVRGKLHRARKAFAAAFQKTA
jgi:RNA polymerase sigma-70 factor, ECF subfamily